MIVYFENYAKTRKSQQVDDVEQSKPCDNVSVVTPISSPPDKKYHAEWPAADLADFYRILGVLQRSGFDVEFVHGVTDEGDLWAVFEHTKTNQEVLSISLIDRVYTVLNSVTDECIEGASLAEITSIIDSKTRNSQHFDVRSSFDQNISTKEKLKGFESSNVIMHPSACLIAYTATALLLIDLIISSDVEAAETIASIDRTHLASLTDEDHFLESLFSSNKNNSLKRHAEPDEDKSFSDKIEENIPSLEHEGNSSSFNVAQSTNLGRLQNLIQDVGSLSILTSIIAMTAWVVGDDKWAFTLSEKIKNIKTEKVDDRSSVIDNEYSEVSSASDGYEEPNNPLSFVANQKNIFYDDKLAQDISDTFLDVLSKPIDQLFVDNITSAEKIELTVHEKSHSGETLSYTEDLSFFGLLATEKSGIYDVTELQYVSPSKSDDVVTLLSKDEFNNKVGTEENYQPISTNYSKFNDLLVSVEISFLNKSNFIKSAILERDNDYLNYLLNEPNNDIQNLTKKDSDNNSELLGFQDYDVHISKSDEVEIISFADLGKRSEALIFYSGTAIVENFKPGIDAIFLVGEQQKYENIAVINQDLHLYINDLNKIVLIDFFAFDTIV